MARDNPGTSADEIWIHGRLVTLEKQHHSINLHIGLSKTATTTLQKALFRTHSQIRYLGQYVPSSTSMLCETEAIYQILRPLLWDTDQPVEWEKMGEAIAKQFDHSDQQVVASWEGLVSRSVTKNAEMFRRVKQAFGNCRVLLTLRNPLTRLPSEYIENLKGHFIKGIHPWIGNLPYISMDQWIERASSAGHLPNMLSYSQTIEVAVKILGKENVAVFLFEELNENPNIYFKKICHFLKIDPTEGLALATNQHLHLRRTEGELEFLQNLNRSPMKRLLLKMAGHKKRRRVLDSQSDGKPATTPEFSTTWLQHIHRETAKGHRWLEDTFQLPLSDYGYPMSPNS
jgi:hypothetical protein